MIVVIFLVLLVWVSISFGLNLCMKLVFILVMLWFCLCVLCLKFLVMFGVVISLGVIVFIRMLLCVSVFDSDLVRFSLVVLVVV